MKAIREVTGLESSPDGYVFSAGKMVEAFESATRSLEPGQLSGIVESEFGYHIILRLDHATSRSLSSAYWVRSSAVGAFSLPSWNIPSTMWL